MTKQRLMGIFNAALGAADPYNAVKRGMRREGDQLLAPGISCDLENFDRLIVVGAGKGTAPMAQAVEDILGDRINEGIIVVKYGHTRPLKKIRQIEASHPIPDEAGVKGTGEIVRLLEKADERTLVICLLSGGGSALLVSPAEGLTLRDKQHATDLLLRSGAAIDEVNAVRKHLSRVKGGRLAGIACPASLITLILSDVIGDRLDVIASGPTVADGSSFGDAASVIDKYGIRDRLPEGVRLYLERGKIGEIADTPKAGDRCFDKGTTVIVGSLRHALDCAKKAAEEMGYETTILMDSLQGEVREAAGYLAGMAKGAKITGSVGRPKCLISGGETTVKVKGKGTGGRNQELALAFALEVEGVSGISLLSAGTDGTDGPTDAAGAIVNGETAVKAKKAGIDPASFLENNDSYNFFKKYDSVTGEKTHLITGPTGTNVMDVQIITVD